MGRKCLKFHYEYHLPVLPFDSIMLSLLEVTPGENIILRIARIVCHLLQQCACNAISTFLLKHLSESLNGIDITVIKQQTDSQNNS